MSINRVGQCIAILAACGAVAVTMTADAQTPRSGGSASSQLLEQMQQLASERSALQGENDKLKKQLADLTKDRDALKAGQQTVQRHAQEASAALAHSTSQREATEQELTQLKGKMQELIAKFRETLTQMRAMETEATVTKQQLAARDHELSACVDRNVGLYHLNDEILTRMEKRPGLFSCMAGEEPFTKIKRVRLENLADDYRAHAQDLKVSPTGQSKKPGPLAPAAPVGLPAPEPSAAPAPAATQKSP